MRGRRHSHDRLFADMEFANESLSVRQRTARHRQLGQDQVLRLCVAPSEKIMTEPRKSEHHPKVHQQKKYYGVASTKGGAAAAVVGRTAYREEYQRDYGPDLDESLDGTESGHEI
jgi:hypothetical protein